MLFGLTDFQILSLGLSFLSTCFLAVLAWQRNNLNKRMVEKPNIKPIGFKKSFRDNEKGVTSYKLLIENQGPGDARKAEVSSLSYFGFYGERSSTNPAETRRFEPAQANPKPSHIAKGEKSRITVQVPEGESDDRPNQVDRIVIYLETERTGNRLGFYKDEALKESNYEGKTDSYSEGTIVTPDIPKNLDKLQKF